jgi:universal stress protein A
MPRLRRVLFATDFSKASSRAFTTAVAMAKVHGAALIIVHVIIPIPPIVSKQYISAETWQEIDRQARHWSQRRLRKLIEKATSAGIRAVGLILDGSPAQQIVNAARSRQTDLVIVGTHGRTGFTKFILGSVAGRVIATAPCPVVTVRSQ